MLPDCFSLFVLILSIIFISSLTFIAVWTLVTLTINIIINSFFNALSAENLVTVSAHHGLIYLCDIPFIIPVTKRANQGISTFSFAIRNREPLFLSIFYLPLWINLRLDELGVSVFVLFYLFLFLCKELCVDLLLFIKVSLIVFQIVLVLV